MWFLSTVTVVVLLFGYHTSTSGALTAQDTVIPSTAAPGASGSRSSGTGSTSGASGQPRTVTGPAVQTEWGPVQVQVTTKGGTITDVAVPVYPSDNPRDQQINDYALPILVQETLDAQSANIDMVSGATVTSTGYIGSLQATLDKAGL